MSQIKPNLILSAKNNLRNRNDFSYMAVCQFNAKVYVSNHKLHIRLIEKLPIVILRGHLCKSFVWAIKNIKFSTNLFMWKIYGEIQETQNLKRISIEKINETIFLFIFSSFAKHS